MKKYLIEGDIVITEVDGTDPPIEPPIEPPIDPPPVDPGESPVENRMDVTRPDFTGETFYPTPENANQVINDAPPGSIIKLDPNLSYPPLKIEEKSNPEGKYTLITTAGEIPATLGERIDGADGYMLPEIRGEETGHAINIRPRASYLRFEGVRFEHVGERMATLIEISSGQDGKANQAHHLVFDRIVARGNDNPAGYTRRGFAANGHHIGIIQSHIDRFQQKGGDTQAIHSGQGSVALVQDNYLEASGENFYLGGTPGQWEGFVPEDWELFDNTIMKPLSWCKHLPEYDGRDRTVKNLMEFKKARRIHSRGNHLINNWSGQGQGGAGLVITPRTSGGQIMWAHTQDMLFEDDLWENVEAWCSIAGVDDQAQVEDPNFAEELVTRNIHFRNIRAGIGGCGREGFLLQILQGSRNLTFAGVTWWDEGGGVRSHLTGYGHKGPPGWLVAPGHTGFSLTQSQGPSGRYDISFGDGGPYGEAGLDRHCPGWVYELNTLTGVNRPEQMPPDNDYI